MFTGNKAHRAQSMLEYCVFLSVALCALLFMQFIIMRSYSGRIKMEADSVGLSYSPGHSVGDIKTTTNTRTHTYTSGVVGDGDDLAAPGVWNEPITPGMIVSFSSTTTTFNKDEKIDAVTTE